MGWELLRESEQFRQSVTGCFSSCTASLGIFLQAERGFFWALCCSPGIYPSIMNRGSRAARGREQPHPWMLVEKGYHTHGDAGAGIDPDHPALTKRVPCSSLLLRAVFLSPNPRGFLTTLVEKPFLHSATSSQEVAKIPGHLTWCCRDSWGLPASCKGRGENRKGFWRMWLLGCSGRVWFTGWSLGDGYLQLWSGFVLICSTKQPCPRVGAAWHLHSSHHQVRNHENHSPGCKEGAANTLSAAWCPAAPICSPPRAPEAVLLAATIPVDVKCCGTKLLGNGCSRGGRSARCSQPSSPSPGTLPLQAI